MGLEIIQISLLIWRFQLSNTKALIRHLPEGLNIVGTVSSSGEIRQVELNLIPALIKSHRHGADERLDTSGRLIVGSSESTTHVLVIEYLDLEGEVLLQVLDDHDQEG